MRKYVYIKIKNEIPKIINAGDWHSKALDEAFNLNPASDDYFRKLKEVQSLHKTVKMTEESDILYVQSSISSRIDYSDKKFINDWAIENEMKDVVYGNIKGRIHMKSYNFSKNFKKAEQIDLGFDRPYENQNGIKLRRPQKKDKQIEQIDLGFEDELEIERPKENIQENTKENNLMERIVETYKNDPQLQKSINRHLNDLTGRRFPYEESLLKTPGKILAYLGGNYLPAPKEKRLFYNVSYEDLIKIGLFEVIDLPNGERVIKATNPNINNFF